MDDAISICLHNPSLHAKKPTGTWCWYWLFTTLSLFSISRLDPTFGVCFPSYLLYWSPAAFCCEGLVAARGWCSPAPAKATAFMVALSIKAANVGDLVANTGPAFSTCHPAGKPACHKAGGWTTALVKLRGQCDWCSAFPALPSNPGQRGISSRNVFWAVSAWVSLGTV